MKKKPPPGATLIARLKEQRLAREAELARRQAGETEESTPALQTPIKPVQQAPETSAPVNSVKSNGADGLGETDTKPAAIESSVTDIVEVEAADIDDNPGVSGGNRQTVVVSSRVHKPSQPGAEVAAPVANALSAGDLLHREIDIDDLRPTSDDYFVLTDEIRLAGRFAAVGLIAQGLRLQRLRDSDIYKNHYQTYEDYCRKEHQMSATYVYRLIRMAEMAERVAQLGSASGGTAAANDAMPDPFEVMLGLGHRHLMALLPLEVETAQELLTKGIPLLTSDENGGGTSDTRLPISRATEKQIREALKVLAPTPEKVALKVVEKKTLATEKQLIPALNKLVEMLEDWSLWLGGDAPEELQAARMGRAQLLNRLAKRFRAASGQIADALEGTEE